MTKFNKIKRNHLDFYTQNSDWKERIVEGDYEIIKYQNDTIIRIWYNEQNQNFKPHWHTALEVIIPVENYYEVIASSTTYHILPGEILIIPSGETHQLIAPETGKRFIFLFDISNISRLKGFSCIQSMLNSCLYMTKQTYPQIYEDIYQLLLQIRNEYFGNNEIRELAIYSHLINLFVIFGRNRVSNTDIFPNVRIYKQKEYMQKFNNVLDYIDSHYMEDLTLDDIASYSGFSKYHFTRLFKQYTEFTFYDYLSYKRIKTAENLLAKPDLSITEIALQSGFTSITTFNRIFKHQKNCTPSEYRALYSKVHYTN
ncbi:AraC-like DNA-binding protein [Lachnotalea glycerini]|jgi:AraC-like DNA-binding protein|uniref:AraC family transcriptional regulator n=1 Tax=Lachnotalea glycerini TaxID=1763509 RepID=A0A255I5G5_9FIRM|nr:AraC family transcriptional regulator [Lachnotalea glycerini]PXV95859.1 AraC-like DNA-binding protein [Lachnotalea glycerini]RDY33083.1 AraC family transcriptional regulator [Lachnotalea glycerini]